MNKKQKKMLYRIIISSILWLFFSFLKVEGILKFILFMIPYYIIVNSKSELIIADTLNRLGIPYKYERPLPLLNGEGRLTVYPDFTCLNLRSRQEFIWEHFGMLDDPNYAETTVAKLKNYADNRIFPGTELIISTETPAAPINTREVEKIIKKYLM